MVEATVSYSSKDAIVDVNRIQQILDRDYKQQKTEVSNVQTVHKTDSSDTTAVKEAASSLWWLLLLLILLLLLLAAILVICCICKPCPLYVPPKKRKVASSEATKLVVNGAGQGRDSKSVQVAEWFGRREAWSPEAVAVQVDGEAESLRKHEMERGSERGAKRTLQRQQNIVHEVPRDHLYIRDGNAEILRLVTRGGEQQRPITLVADHPYLADSGKDILMRRFIEQQQNEASRAQALLPNAINKLQAEHELLETSLRQQNALLRQILVEREREMRLETQSLPAGTQTDQDAGTQTEPRYLRPSKRRVRSDNDASDISDDEAADIRARSRRRYGKRGVKIVSRRQIKTPILEESESNVESLEKQQKGTSTESSGKLEFKHTRTSLMRQKKTSDESNQSARSSRSLRREVLREISDSLAQSDESNSENENYARRRRRKRREVEEMSDDSLEDDYTPRSLDSYRLHKYHSESDLRKTSSKSKASRSAKSQSHTDLRKVKGKAKRVSRYMDWYYKAQDSAKAKREEAKKLAEATKEAPKVAISQRLLADTESSARKKVAPKNKVGPEHPLLQHSEHRFEAQYPIRRQEEDDDSGIVLTKPPIAQKKSVFTIAYDDMHTSQLRPESSTP